MSYYVELPKKIRAGEVTKAAQVARLISPIYPTDAQFELAFTIKILRDSRKARYLLLELEKSFSNGTREITKDSTKVNLEHILPKNPTQDWNDALNSIESDLRSEYTYRLGNLALIAANTNKGLSSKSFSIKREAFAKEEDIHFTAMLSDYSSWSKESIHDRQCKLAKEAVKCWHIEVIR